MQTLKELDTQLAEQWRVSSAIQLWQHQLLNLVGLTADEVAHRVDTFFQFCFAHHFEPETIARECRHGQDKLARRAFYLQTAQKTSANLIVQSFLVHNGINIFGDLICMPKTPEQILAEQGQQWLKRAQ